jgi:hypothetical protein
MIAVDEVQVGGTARRRRPGSARAWLGVALVVVAVVVAPFLGYRAGVHAGHQVTVRTGVAWSSGQQATVSSHGVYYDVPLGAGSVWYDGGSEHFGGPPACLPPLHAVTITFGTVSFSRDGALNSRVAWVRC